MVRIYTYLEIYLDDLNKKVSLREFEKYFHVPHQTIKGYLASFVQAKILTEEKKTRFLFYGLNAKNPLTKEYLLLCEKERLLNMLEKNQLIARLYQVITPIAKDTKVLLFGSAIKEKTFNDIDILIIGNNDKVKEKLKNFEQTHTVKFHIIQTKEKDLTQTFLIELRKKHLIINNHEYFFTVLYHDY